MAPAVAPAESSPIVAVPMPRLALIVGSRGPHTEMVIPPSPNAAVTVTASGPAPGVRSGGSLQAWLSATSWPSSARTQATISVVGAPGVKILATPIR
jgi:hypothetical protein